MYGFCGRAVVVEDAGLPLDLFLSETWIERAKLAAEVIKIAKRLTRNQEHWGLYFKEVSMGNFAVSTGPETNRTVKLVDAEQVLVVDLSESNVKGSLIIICKWSWGFHNIEKGIVKNS